MYFTTLYDRQFYQLIEEHTIVGYSLNSIFQVMKNKIFENELTATIPTVSAKYTMSSSHLVLSQLFMQPDPTVGIREDMEPAQVQKETFQNVHSIKYIKNENMNSTTDIPAGSVLNKKTNRMK